MDHLVNTAVGKAATPLHRLTKLECKRRKLQTTEGLTGKIITVIFSLLSHSLRLLWVKVL